MGGLIGTLVGFIYIMSVYSEKAYGVSMASELFTDDDGGPICSASFHPGYLVTLGCNMVSKLLCCGPPKWDRTQFDSRCLEEVEEQLDVAMIMKQITFFERVLNTFVDEQQLE